MRIGSLRALSALAGAVLLTVAALLAWQHFTTPAPYHYTAPVAAGELSRVDVVADDGKALAEVEVAAAADGPVLMSWRAQVDDPLLYLAVPADETKILAEVLQRHRAADTPLLAWWDVSRQLRHRGVGGAVFDSHLGVPLFVPERWSMQRERVASVERAFWGATDDAERARFDSFTRALAAPEDEGVKLLRSLVLGRKAVIVVHLRDMLLLGQLHPQQLSVAFQDFTDSGDVHRSVRGVHGWLREGDHAAYGVLKLPANLLRTIALQDEASANALAARLLPFIGNKQDDVPGLTLVWRSGGYSVFELSAAGTP